MIVLLVVLAVLFIAIGGSGLLMLYAIDQRTAENEPGYFGDREG